MEIALRYLAAAVAVIFIFAPHEFAHAFTAYKCGDGTAQAHGRLTLNPVKHLDPVGFVMCIATGFGWAKPVPINPYNFKKYRKGLFLTSVAGVITNYVFAFFAYLLCLIFLQYVYINNYEFISSKIALDYFIRFIISVFYLIYAYGLSVFVFNLLPFKPLDGYRVVEALTRQSNPVRRFLSNYGRYILLILVLESFLCNALVSYADLYYARYFDILGYAGWFAQKIIGYPITALWDFAIKPEISPLYFVFI